MMFSKDFFPEGINPLPNGKILDWSELKTFADDKINVAEKMSSLSLW